MNQLTLQAANDMIKASFLEAKRLSLQPLSIVVLDAGGHVWG
jgi:uncharacterized protein GlcG (DUF336 family)